MHFNNTQEPMKAQGPHQSLRRAVSAGQSSIVTTAVRHTLGLLDLIPLLSILYAAVMMVLISRPSLLLGLIVGPNVFLNLMSFNKHFSFLLGTIIADLPFILLLPNIFYIILFVLFKYDNTKKMLCSLDDGDVVLATAICASASAAISLFHLYESLATRLASRRALADAGFPLPTPLSLLSGFLRWELFPFTLNGNKKVIKDVPIKTVQAKSVPSMQASSYKEGTQEVRCDVHYTPSASPKPVVLYIHGGAWVLGGKDLGIISQLIARCSAEGWVVVSLDYRLAPHATFDEMLKDCQDAVRFIRSGGLSSACDRDGLKVDPKTLVISGDSAGGHLCNLLHLNSSEFPDTCVDGMIDMFGPTDILSVPSTLQLWESVVFKCTFKGNEELFKKANPSSYDIPECLKKTRKIPWINFIGTVDGLVPIEYNREYYTRVANFYGNENGLVRVEAKGSFHGFCGINSHKTETFLEASAALLRQVKANKEEAANRI